MNTLTPVAGGKIVFRPSSWTALKQVHRWGLVRTEIGVSIFFWVKITLITIYLDWYIINDNNYFMSFYLNRTEITSIIYDKNHFINEITFTLFYVNSS